MTCLRWSASVFDVRLFQIGDTHFAISITATVDGIYPTCHLCHIGFFPSSGESLDLRNSKIVDDIVECMTS